MRVSGAKGKAPPFTLKVSAAYRDGYKVEGMLAIIGPDAARKARRAGEIVLQRVRDAGYELARSHIECLGSGDLVPGVLTPPSELPECILRIAAADPRKEALECLAASRPLGDLRAARNDRLSLRPTQSAPSLWLLALPD